MSKKLIDSEWEENFRKKMRLILNNTKKTKTQDMNVQLEMTAGFDEKNEKVTLRKLIDMDFEPDFSKMSWKKRSEIAIDRINVKGEEYQRDIVGEYIKNYKEGDERINYDRALKEIKKASEIGKDLVEKECGEILIVLKEAKRRIEKGVLTL
ncbi:MAG: hypothetical protein WBH31_17710 [Promethearchaeia archaeon]